jgi:hypothetical protein
MVVAQRSEHDDRGLVIEAARAAVTQEFQIAERLDSKARNQMTVAAAWYGVVQAAASIVLKSHNLSNSWRWVILSLAIAGGAAFALALLFSFLVWRVRDEKEITVDGLAQMAAAAQDVDRDFEGDLVEHYRSILQARRKTNKRRVDYFRRSEWPWGICVVTALAEIIVTFAMASQAHT